MTKVIYLGFSSLLVLLVDTGNWHITIVRCQQCLGERKYFTECKSQDSEERGEDHVTCCRQFKHFCSVPPSLKQLQINGHGFCRRPLEEAMYQLVHTSKVWKVTSIKTTFSFHSTLAVAKFNVNGHWSKQGADFNCHPNGKVCAECHRYRQCRKTGRVQSHSHLLYVFLHQVKAYKQFVIKSYSEDIQWIKLI